MYRAKRESGFTLIELMIVVVIIGILASLAIPRFMEATNKAKQSEVKLIMKQIYVNERTFKQQSMANTYYQPPGIASSASPQAFSLLWVEVMSSCRYSFSIVATNNTFLCTATANLDDDADIDTWTIDHTGALINTINDVG